MQGMTLGFFTNPQKQSAVDGLLAGLKEALSLGYSCCVDAPLLSMIPDKLPTIDQKTPDFILAFGGDGTILRAAELGRRDHFHGLGDLLGGFHAPDAGFDVFHGYAGHVRASLQPAANSAQ